jgi:hypothetical protein
MEMYQYRYDSVVESGLEGAFFQFENSIIPDSYGSSNVSSIFDHRSSTVRSSKIFLILLISHLSITVSALIKQTKAATARAPAPEARKTQPSIMSADPLSILSNPPSTVVKVQGTTREDMNGQLGIAVQFNAERGRYNVHLVSSQTIMALKPDNIAKASTMETYQAQAQQVYKDPRTRQEMTRFYNIAHTKMGIKPEYAAGLVLLLFIAAIYFLGFSRTLMVVSMIMMIALIVGPDVASGLPPRAILTNFPRRCRETIEQSAPFAQGRLTDQMAAGIIIIMLVFAGRSLIHSPTRAASAAAFSSSSPGTFDSIPRDLSAEQGDQLYDMPPAPPPSKPSFGFGQAMSVFYIYRAVMQLGNDATGFDVQRAIANAQTMDMWQMGILAFSVYNLVRGFI